jgi:hypothetical protein
MSNDIIEEAIKNDVNTQEKSASGEVEGKLIDLEKKKYTTRAQRTFWKVTVSIGGAEHPSEKRTQLSAEKAENIFQKLVDKHSLSLTSEGPNVDPGELPDEGGVNASNL